MCGLTSYDNKEYFTDFDLNEQELQIMKRRQESQQSGLKRHAENWQPALKHFKKKKKKR